MYQLLVVVFAINLGSGGIHSTTTPLGQYAKKDDCLASVQGPLQGRLAEKVAPNRSNDFYEIVPVCVLAPASQ
jgi:hypothetical protein